MVNHSGMIGATGGRAMEEAKPLVRAGQGID